VTATVLNQIFDIVFVLVLITLFFGSPVVMGVVFLILGCWVTIISIMSYIHEETALQLARQNYIAQRRFGWGFPHWISAEDFGPGRFHRKFKESRHIELLFGTIGALLLFIIGTWLIVR
jgi:hypothetical protein